MFCYNCGKEFNSQFCPHCGVAAPKEREVVEANQGKTKNGKAVFCYNCGKEFNSQFCPHCGAAAPKESEVVEANQGKTKNGKAVASLVFGVFAVATLIVIYGSIPSGKVTHSVGLHFTNTLFGLFGFGTVCAIIGIILGVLAPRDSRTARRGLISAGLVLSIIELIALTVVLFMYAAVAAKML